MPREHDFRTKNNDELTFYVFDDLNGGGVRDLFRFDTAKEAMEKFQTFPSDYKTAIGVNIYEFASVDLIHRENGNPIKVVDYKNSDLFSNREDVENALKELETGLSVLHQYMRGILPNRSVIVPTECVNTIDSYLNNKVLYVSPRPYAQALFAAMNEVYVEGMGWMDSRDFLRTYRENPAFPIVRKINVTYKETDTGYLGQCDMSPVEFVHMMEKTKEYEQSFADKKPAIKRPEIIKKNDSIDEKIRSAKNEKEQTSHNAKAKKEVER